MRFSIRQLFATRRPLMLLMVPALLTTTFAAIAVDPATPVGPSQPAHIDGVVLLNGAVVTPSYGGRRSEARLVAVSAGRQVAHIVRAPETPLAPAGGPGPTTQLHLIKVVRNDNGGPALETDWILEAAGERTDGPSPLSGTSPVDSGPDFKPDRYTLSETFIGSDPRVGEGYTASAWSCVDSGTGEPVAVTPDSQVVVNFGDDITCTIINTSSLSTPTPSPTPTVTPTPTSPSGPCTEFRISGRKLYWAYEGPFKGGLVGLAGWTVTATLVGVEEVTLSTTTDALGQYEFLLDYPGPMAFPGATIRVCEQPRARWVTLAPACATVTLPYPPPPSCTIPVPDFVNAQEHLPPVDP